MKITMLQQAIQVAQKNSPRLQVIAYVNGQPSTANPRSNLAQAIKAAQQDGWQSVTYVLGARRHRRTEGYKMAILGHK